MTGAMAWTTRQIRSMRPTKARPADAVAEVAEWVCQQRERVTYHEVMRARECGRFHAMRVLREAVVRGLLVRYRARRPHTPDEFGSPTKCST